MCAVCTLYALIWSGENYSTKAKRQTLTTRQLHIIATASNISV